MNLNYSASSSIYSLAPSSILLIESGSEQAQWPYVWLCPCVCFCPFVPRPFRSIMKMLANKINRLKSNETFSTYTLLYFRPLVHEYRVGLNTRWIFNQRFSAKLDFTNQKHTCSRVCLFIYLFIYCMAGPESTHRQYLPREFCSSQSSKHIL